MIADIKLLPEAEKLLAKWSAFNDEKPTAYHQPTDVSDWGQLISLWKTSLEKLGRIDIVCNGAGIYEPPSSNFWNPPGISRLAEDKADASPGGYKTFDVNTTAPIRLAQIAMDYWMNEKVEGNLLWVASLGGYVHSFHTPLYFASKAAIVSFVKSLARLRTDFGIRNAAICPGTVDVSHSPPDFDTLRTYLCRTDILTLLHLTQTPIFDREDCRDRVQPGDLMLTPDECASVMQDILTDPRYGDGNIVEAMAINTEAGRGVGIREVIFNGLYPTSSGYGENNHIAEAEEKFVQRVLDKGMRE
jgi:NAD(P)-dependent dehydrogenase (short-subunit alcohol dehydrogenase family)